LSKVQGDKKLTRGCIEKNKLVHGGYYWGFSAIMSSTGRWHEGKNAFFVWSPFESWRRLLLPLSYPEKDDMQDTGEEYQALSDGVFYPFETVDFGTDEIPFPEEI
jgi:hypothetical protein